MAIMLLSQFAEYMGVDSVTMWRYYKANRLTGVTRLKPRITIVDTTIAKILPPVNHERRTTGHPIGRSKPLRGEPGFVEKQ